MHDTGQLGNIFWMQSNSQLGIQVPTHVDEVLENGFRDDGNDDAKFITGGIKWGSGILSNGSFRIKGDVLDVNIFGLYELSEINFFLLLLSISLSLCEHLISSLKFFFLSFSSKLSQFMHNGVSVVIKGRHESATKNWNVHIWRVNRKFVETVFNK